MMGDTARQFGTVTRTLHWLVAFLVGWQALKFADRIDEGEHWVGQVLVPWHISIGTLILVFAILWIVWAGLQRPNRPKHDPAMASYVKAGHGLIFLGLILMPLTGILRMVGGGYPVEAFGIELIGPGPEIAWAGSIGSLHSPLAFVMAALIVGHTIMAFVHQFSMRDNVIGRMTRGTSAS